MIISHYHNITDYYTYNDGAPDYLIVSDYHHLLYPTSIIWGINVSLSHTVI